MTKTSAKRKRSVIEMVVPPATRVQSVPANYQGDVFIWDLDKTYLRTEFATLRELIRTALQKATDKIAYPGAAPLLRALRQNPLGGVRPLYFVSASPPQLSHVIHEKLALDGIEVDGVYFKDNLQNMRPGRLRRLKEQMGYKLLALLDLRKKLPDGAVETFFGDDVETDAIIYALYEQILGKTIERGALVEFLRKQGVFYDEAVRIAWRARHALQRRAHGRIYIQVHRAVDPRYYRRFGAGVRATTNYFQCALLLHVDGKISLDAVALVAEELLSRGGVPRSRLLEDLDEVVRRRLLPDTAAVPLIRSLSTLGVLPVGMSS